MDSLLQETLTWLERLAEEVSLKANDYPRNPIRAEVWRNGATIRKWSEPLVELFDRRQNKVDKTKTLQLKCQVTGSIMSHYPSTVGPDMIEAAAALEAIGETDICKRYFKAILADFESMAKILQEHPDEPVTQEDILSMRALLAAYNGLNRLEDTDLFAEERGWLDGFIAKGVTKWSTAGIKNGRTSWTLLKKVSNRCPIAVSVCLSSLDSS